MFDGIDDLRKEYTDASGKKHTSLATVLLDC